MTNLNFYDLDISHRDEIETFVKQFLPYSDFNFISLVTYNTQETTQFCYYKKNLIIKFEDYDTNENFLSFIGSYNIYQTILDLLSYSTVNHLPSKLGLIPEQIIDQLSPNEQGTLIIDEDRDNFDYIVSAADVAELNVELYPKKRKLVDNFKMRYPGVSSKLIDLSLPENHQAILQTFEKWRLVNNKISEETSTELTAIKRLLAYQDRLHGLYAIGIYDEEQLIAFNTFDIVDDEYGISSFQKANKEYEGIYAFLTTSAAVEMVKLGVKFINYEQDLGINGLRSSKLSWHPVKFLKKYSVSLSE